MRLSDPVEKYYPEIRKVTNIYSTAQPVTLLQLATHTAGLDQEPGDIQTYTTGQVADWGKTLLAALPHTNFRYEQFVQQHILRPLGMSHSAFEQNGEILTTLAKGYILHDGTADPKPSAVELRDGRGYKIPNGALFTTVGDLTKFVSFEMGDGPESVLKKSILADNRSRVYSSDGGLSSGYGVGFMLSRQGDLISVGHSGSAAAMSPAPTSIRSRIPELSFCAMPPAADSTMAALEALSK